MNKIIHILTLLSLIGFISCDDVDFLPIEGTVEGIITDNNGKPLKGVLVTATFTEPSSGGQAIENTKTSTTQSDGFYRLNNLWDEVTLNASYSGFLPVSTLIELTNKNNNQMVDFILTGSPTINAVTLSKASLSASQPDTLAANIAVLDEFNSLSQGYVAKLLLLRQDGTTAAITDALLVSEGLKDFLFQALVTADSLPAGPYQVAVEVRDPDGNEHGLQSGEISVE